jgi:hypothetical protein
VKKASQAQGIKTIASTVYAYLLESIMEGTVCPPASFILKTTGWVKKMVNDVQQPILEKNNLSSRKTLRFYRVN